MNCGDTCARARACGVVGPSTSMAVVVVVVVWSVVSGGGTCHHARGRLSR